MFHAMRQLSPQGNLKHIPDKTTAMFQFAFYCTGEF